MNPQIDSGKSDRQQTIALIFDLPEKLVRNDKHPFPSDAEAEWETRQTIERISAGWRKNGYEVIELPLDKNFLIQWSSCVSQTDLVHTLTEGWGTPSREAWIPALCELSGIPFIGSPPFAQCMAMRKSTFKIICHYNGIPTPEFRVVQSLEDVENLPDAFLARPHFIKPDCEGSGMGIDAETSIPRTVLASRETCIRMLSAFPDGLLIEELLTGAELTSAFLGHAPFESLPIAQIEVPTGVYGLANKSKDEMGEKISFPKLSTETRSIIEKSMHILQQRVGLEDFARFDWKLDGHGRPFLLEVNPLAGLSYYYSVLPKMAEAAGYDYDQLLNRLAQSALRKAHHRRFWYGRSRLQADSE
ncbi:MAG: hypothetical protein RLZZ488_2582 [Pseudomonadota bacterium]|jgi:D-alanine-D-alanine ligase